MLKLWSTEICMRDYFCFFLRLISFWVSLAVILTHADDARADIAVRIGLARQEMNVEVDGIHYATWAVSTARRGYRTPEGTYTPYLLDRMHYSKLYDYTPMPYSIFFLRGYAIHGTTEVRNLGRAVSHGCVRLRPDNAKRLFDLVSIHGLQSTSISIIK
jgi:lipoprotein-anchoring transpeptidase ErfK/SrfK